MVSDDPIELEVFTDDQMLQICSVQCGAKCCKRVGDTFRVFISISEYAQLKQEGLSEYIEWGGLYPHLQTNDDGSCVFLDENNSCSIHQYRPLACRNYPFRHLKENIEEFCMLYDKAPEEFRQHERKVAEEKFQSIGDHIFDVSPTSAIYNEYISKISSTD